jgi:xanthine dehydrogenase YagS FAD-binding subunit
MSDGERVVRVDEWCAGATDLQDRRNRGMPTGRLIDLVPDPARTSVRAGADGARIGALVRVQTLADDAEVRSGYRGLADAAAGLATPQIRAVATCGGALLQRNRCWYFRQPFFICYKKGGTNCPAREGDHRFGVLVDLGPCIWPHPSSLGVALTAYGGVVETNRGRRLAMRELFGEGRDPARDHWLEPGEVLEAIVLPPPVPDERAAYVRGIARHAAEWPLVEVVVRLTCRDDRIADVVVAAGAIANVPMRLETAEAALRGCLLREARAALSDLTVSGALLPDTRYKLPLLRGCVANAVDLALTPAQARVTRAALEWPRS